jgi:hypothetical protein
MGRYDDAAILAHLAVVAPAAPDDDVDVRLADPADNLLVEVALFPFPSCHGA